MQGFEYRVVPAPRRGAKAKGVRSAEERFARSVEAEMNRMAIEGWDYVRSETLPCEERRGLFGGVVTVHRPLLVFRRPVAPDVVAGGWAPAVSVPTAPAQVPTPQPVAAALAPMMRPPSARAEPAGRAAPAPSPLAASSLAPAATPRPMPSPGLGASLPPTPARPAPRFAVRPEREPGGERVPVLERALDRMPVTDPRLAFRNRETPVAMPAESPEDDEVSIPGPRSMPSQSDEESGWPEPTPGRPPRP